jgi:hypothetical protein
MIDPAQNRSVENRGFHLQHYKAPKPGLHLARCKVWLKFSKFILYFLSATLPSSCNSLHGNLESTGLH